MKNYFFLFPSLFICLSFSNFHLVARLTSFDQQKQLLQKNILEESKHRFNLKGNYVANDFYVTNFSDSVVGDHFFIINFVLTGNMFNYLRSVTRQTTSLAPNEFISSFIEGYISLKTLQES